MRFKNSRFAVCLLLLFVLMAACKDSQLRTLANAFDKITTASAAIRETVVAAHKTPGGLSTDASIKIGTVMLKVDIAIQQAIGITQNIAMLDPASKAKLTDIAKPILAAVDAAVKDPALAGISNTKARDTIREQLVLIQTTLNAVELVLAAGGK